MYMTDEDRNSGRDSVVAAYGETLMKMFRGEFDDRLRDVVGEEVRRQLGDLLQGTAKLVRNTPIKGDK